MPSIKGVWDNIHWYSLSSLAPLPSVSNVVRHFILFLIRMVRSVSGKVSFDARARGNGGNGGGPWGSSASIIMRGGCCLVRSIFIESLNAYQGFVCSHDWRHPSIRRMGMRSVLAFFRILLRYAIIFRVCLLGRFYFEQIPKSVLRLLSTARKKFEAGSLFKINMPAALRVRDYILVMGTDNMF